MKKYIATLLFIPSIATAQTCNIGTASGEIPDHCITDVPPVPSAHFTMPPYARPISVIGEPTSVSVIPEPTYIEPAPKTKRQKISALKKKISTLKKRVRKYQGEIKRLEKR